MILAHDVGTSGDKATLLSNDGIVLASTTEPYPTVYGPDGVAEQNPLDWWSAFSRATRALVEKVGASAGDIDVVVVSGQMMGVVALDAHGTPVRPAMIWADTRSGEQAERVLARIPMERMYEITGHRVNPTYMLTKMMWLQDHEPDTFARIHTVLNAKDFLVHRLTGIVATDPSDASGSNAYDQRSAKWSDEILDTAGIPRRLLPEIVPSTTVVGTVIPDAARTAGLSAGIPVVMGGGDGPIASVGAGIISPESGGYACLGSSAWVSVSASEPLHDPLMRSMTFNHVVPGQFIPIATMQAAGTSLEWITEVLEPTSGTSVESLIATASARAACDDGIYFLPYLLGERSPYWNPRARAAFLGMQRHHDRGQLLRAVVEGIAFNLQTGLEALRSSGVVLDRIDVIGGLAKSSLARTIIASTWDMPVSRRNLTDETNALGAAVVGGVGVGIFSGFDVATRLSVTEVTQLPDPDLVGSYTSGYSKFLDAYTRLEGWFDAL